MSNTLLSCEDLSMRFGGLVALNQLNLSVNTGEILGLIGPNGSGKTTFFNVITGIYQASDGRVDYQGHDLARMSAQQIYRAGSDAHLPAFAPVPAAVHFRQPDDRQPPPAESRPVVQSHAARSLPQPV